MGIEQFDFNFDRQAKAENPLIQVVKVSDLETGDWSEDHEATIAHVGPTESPYDRSTKVRLTFYEGKHPPIEVDRDETLRIIKMPS